MDENQIFEIDIDMLQPNPLQPRGLITPDSLIEIVDSIREHGVLEPLVVAKTPAGYQIIAGERRWRASKIGKSAPYVSNTFRLLSVPDALKDALASGATSEGHVRALASLDDPHLIVEAYREVLQKNLSVRGAEELARKLKARENIAPKQQVPAQKLQSEELEKFQEDIAEKLSNGQAKVKVKISQSRVEGKIQVVAKGKVEETFGILKRIRDGVVNS